LSLALRPLGNSDGIATAGDGRQRDAGINVILYGMARAETQVGGPK
jgi:hypothetical protein